MARIIKRITNINNTINNTWNVRFNEIKNGL